MRVCGFATGPELVRRRYESGASMILQRLVRQLLRPYWTAQVNISRGG